jgi:SAM-dependent methyltransferase
MEKFPEPHSGKYIGDHRLEWWNGDYVGLLADRFRLRGAKSLLDVGAGAGHWAAVLLQHMGACRQLICLDNDPHWIQLLGEKRWPTDVSYTSMLADAHEIPLPSNSVDVVTCQTLLMHCARPVNVLREMFRVARVGGQILIVEPVNLLNRFLVPHALRYLSPHERANLIQYISCMHAGKALMEMSDQDIAISLPDMLHEVGAENVTVFQNDKVLFVSQQEVAAIANEMEENDFVSLARAGGASDETIALGNQSARKIVSESVASGGLEFASMNTYVFHATKRSE